MRALLLYYDRYHTPLKEVAASLPPAWQLTSLNVDLGLLRPSNDENEATQDALHVSAMARFAEEYLSRAIKANACYQGGYYLSAAL